MGCSWKLTLSKVATKSKTRMRMWRAETTNRRRDMAASRLAQSRRDKPAECGSTQSWARGLGSEGGGLGKAPGCEGEGE